MKKTLLPWRALRFTSLSCGLALTLNAAERFESFNSDPGWHGHNNRSTAIEPRTVRQDFGYSRTTHTGGEPGEMGGTITAAAEPAWYAKKIPTRTFNDRLEASGKLVCAQGGFHVLVGFFNAGNAKEWRTPNSIAIRLNGRGDHFYAYVEYMTGRWRAGGDTPGGFTLLRDETSGRTRLKGFPSGNVVHDWTLRYDPQGNNGAGSIAVTIDNETSICHLAPAHRQDGATFNRFGLMTVMKSADDRSEVWLDEVTVNGEKENFDRDPGWEEFQNRRTYTTPIVRPRFDFGYSATQNAGGQKAGEMGGMVFRGDGRYPHMMAFYGAPLEELTLDRPLKAAGKVSLRRAVTDADVLFGFFHAEHSLKSGGTDSISTPPDFLGVMIGGPSREGFMFVPGYRLHNTEKRIHDRGPYLYPNGASHDFTFEFIPATGDQPGVLKVTLDQESASMPIPVEHQKMGAHFNRFGLISTHTDGNSQDIYFDDLTYTWSQKE
ncbi:MAG: hypothetical protein AB1813_21785 [Verrucomicrobiota bacterium]